MAALRGGREEGVLKLWPHYVTGEDLFGLTEPAVVRVLESLPGKRTYLIYYLFRIMRLCQQHRRTHQSASQIYPVDFHLGYTVLLFADNIKFIKCLFK